MNNVSTVEQKVNEKPLLPAEFSNSENIKIPLSAKEFAYLAYPTDLKKIDIEILRKQIDLLELLAE